MKICMFTNTFYPHVGGVANSILRFVQDLVDFGHQVLVIAPQFEDAGSEHHDQVEIVRLPAIQNFNGSDFSVRIPIPKLVQQALEKFDPQLVHSHHPFLLGDSAVRAAFNFKTPLVFTHHTLYEQYTHYVPAHLEGMKTFVIHLSTSYANMCSSVIAPSQSIADLIQARGVKTDVQVIPTGVDTDFFAKGDGRRFRREHGIPENAFVYGHVGRLAPEKNLRYLAQAVAGAMAENSEAWFLVVGEGLEAEAISSLFADKSLAHRLVMAGMQQKKNLVDAYHAMDAFVFTSHSETQGMVVTEAMAAGVPVIALNATGVREVVQDEVNGRIPAADIGVDDFSRILSQVAQAGEQLANWSENAQATAHEFDRKRTARKLAKVYEKCLAQHEPERAWAMSNAEKPHERINPWESLLDSIALEWDLFTKKIDAAAKAIQT